MSCLIKALTFLQTIKLVPSNGDETFTLPNPLAVRRVRLVIANFTEEPCFRFEINGCPVKGMWGFPFYIF